MNNKWIFFVSKRFAQVDRSGRFAITSFLASVSICFGVMTLIAVMSVMNGFQLGFIDSIMEISSAHIRITPLENFNQNSFSNFCFENRDEIVAVEPFYEAQSLMASSKGKQTASLIRAVSPTIMYTDTGFAKEIQMISGSFDLHRQDSIVLGSDLARILGVKIGDKVNLLALSGGSDVDLISENRVFFVTGIFSCGYAEINSTYSFISLDAAKKFFGENAIQHYNIKLFDTDTDLNMIYKLKQTVSGVEAESWRSYNISFFGALEIEKNLLMIFVLLIFVVVGVNIFNGMRRMVFERREEIAVLAALGANKKQVQYIFILRGLLTGLVGAIPGLILGLLLCVNMDSVFMLISKTTYLFQYFFYMLFNPEMAIYVYENPMYQVYARIPARIDLLEIILIMFFGIFSSLVASWIASRNIQNLSVSEVLHSE